MNYYGSVQKFLLPCFVQLTRICGKVLQPYSFMAFYLQKKKKKSFRLNYFLNRQTIMKHMKFRLVYINQIKKLFQKNQDFLVTKILKMSFLLNFIYSYTTHFCCYLTTLLQYNHKLAKVPLFSNYFFSTNLHLLMETSFLKYQKTIFGESFSISNIY